MLRADEVEKIRESLVAEGFGCKVRHGEVHDSFDISWKSLDECDKMNALEIALCVIRGAVSGVNINYVPFKSGESCLLLIW